MQTKDQPKRGRRSDYSAEIADTICDRLAGGESLRAICADAGMPDRATVSRWLARYEEFRDLYSSSSASSVTLPPDAAVFTDTTCSRAKWCR
jgi:hypothetical protein